MLCGVFMASFFMGMNVGKSRVVKAWDIRKTKAFSSFNAISNNLLSQNLCKMNEPQTNTSKSTMAWDIYTEPFHCIAALHFVENIESTGKCYKRDLHIWWTLQGRLMLLNYTKSRGKVHQLKIVRRRTQQKVEWTHIMENNLQTGYLNGMISCVLQTPAQ